MDVVTIGGTYESFKPLPHIPLMPTGGINIENTASYIKAGAVAVGVGSTLVNTKEEMTDAYFSHLTEKATKFVEQVQLARKAYSFQ